MLKCGSMLLYVHGNHRAQQFYISTGRRTTSQPTQSSLCTPPPQGSEHLPPHGGRKTPNPPQHSNTHSFHTNQAHLLDKTTRRLAIKHTSLSHNQVHLPDKTIRHLAIRCLAILIIYNIKTVSNTLSHTSWKWDLLVIVSWCLEPRQPHRVISGLSWTWGITGNVTEGLPLRCWVFPQPHNQTHQSSPCDHAAVQGWFPVHWLWW